jgi:hypothetical protein
VKVAPKWLREKNYFADFLSIIKGWWFEGQNLEIRKGLTELGRA